MRVCVKCKTRHSKRFILSDDLWEEGKHDFYCEECYLYEIDKLKEGLNDAIHSEG